MIGKVSLLRFRSHHQTTLELARINTLIGPVGSGKSSILDGIALALSGRNRHVTGKGEGLRDEITVGERGFELSLEHGKLKLSRTVDATKHSLTFRDAPTDLRSAQAALYVMLGANEDLITALLDPTLFLDRPVVDQQRFILKLLRVSEIPVPDVAKRAGVQELHSIEQLDKWLKDTKEGRLRDLNREVKRLEGSLPAADDRPERLSREVEKELTELANRRDDLVKKVERAKADRDAVRTLRESVGKLKAQAAKDVPNAKELAELGEEFSQLSALRAASEASVQTKRTAIEDARQQEGKLQAQVEACRANYKRIVTLGPACSACGQPVSQAFKDVQLKQFADEGNRLKADLDATVNVRRALETEMAKDGQAADVAEGKMDAVASQTAAAKQASEDRKRVLELEKELKEAEKRAQAAVKALDGDTAELDKTNERRVVLQAELDATVQIERRATQRAETLRQVSALHTEAEGLEAAVASLVETKAAILDRNIEPFLESMEEFLAHFRMAPLEVTLDPLRFYVAAVPAGNLSSGQRVVFDAALRVASAKLSGFPCVGMDDANRLGENARRELLAALKAWGGQVIICSTRDVRPETVNPNPDERVFWFDNPQIVGPTHVEQLSALAAVHA